MKRVWIVVVAALMVGTAAIAQTDPWRFSILPGLQGGSGQATYSENTGWVSVRDSGVISVDATRLFNGRVGLHVGLMYSQGKFRTGYVFYPFGLTSEWRVSDFTMSYGIAEVGPEFVIQAGPRGEAYAQVNVGGTFGMSGRKDFSSRQGVRFRDGVSYGAAFGYRFFFGRHAGLAIQGAYHWFDEWKLGTTDLRIGVTFRF